ncbi:MAG: DUF438 domain-containing protein [Lachnospiraceae bacterium]|nr:DUF438 domain-containing protein [Lachnospiraceae bacterium]
MSELINNREMRKETLKNIIRQLHEGKTMDEVKQQFEEVFHGVSASEISEAETALVLEGIPNDEIQNLCDVHASVFKGTIDEIHGNIEGSSQKGHPIEVMKMENREIEKIMEDQIRPYIGSMEEPDSYQLLMKGMERLSKIDLHYSRKENLLFPYLEKYEVTAPPKVMWGVDDEIRMQIKVVQTMLGKSFTDTSEIAGKIKELLDRIAEMIFKEENILFPMLLEKLTEDEWKMIASESREIGYLIDHVPEWKESLSGVKKESMEPKAENGEVVLPTGRMTLEELKNMLNTLPFDITFVGKDDTVKYFSEGKERIFARTKTVIGRTVSNCHPPASVHIVEGIVEDFKSGKKDSEDFWINMGDAFVLIRYFAVRNEQGEYIGVLEVTQNIKKIQQIQGEKRLVE